MLYIRLFHGRTDPQQAMNEWGTDGPVFGPYSYVHTTYSSLVRLGRDNEKCDELYVIERDLLFYDRVYYGDWSVFTDEIFKNSKYKAVKYDPLKARIPAHS
jgi:hypothetical protein